MPGPRAPVLLPDRRIFVFDNGLQRDFTGDPGLFSRGVEYEIDEESMTVRQTWQYGEERGAEYFSSIISNVDYLPETGNRLIAPGITDGDGAFVTEVTYPAGEVVFEARIQFKNQLSTGVIAWGDFDLVYRSRRLSPHP
jgi:arylsulfate sulfotransferase